ncbi:MAG: leucyl aminopeptidase [Actinomycetota bacterium]|nr:leucyl aminopeptidase [Actinomycetota bacterium]
MPLELTAARTIPADAEVVGIPVSTGCRVAAEADVEIDVGFLERRGFDGRLGEAQALLADDGSTIIALGVGDAESVDAESVRRAAAALVRATGTATTAALVLPAGADNADAGQAAAEGSLLAGYRFTTYKSDAKSSPLERLAVVGPGGARLQTGVDRGVHIAGAVAMARDLANEPAGSLTPTRLAEIAVEVAETEGLQVRVLDEAAIREERLGGLLGVSQGSEQPPRLVELVYEPAGRSRGTVVLVGKGITFDSGGLSIKTADGMTTMKTDMSGAADVIAAMSVLPALGCKARVVGIAPITENMPGGAAIKPGDVLRARNGKTMEVLNTDAEGRLVLADGLSLAAEADPDAIIDIATLTGAASVALGRKIAPLMGNDDGLLAQVQAAGDRAGERFWTLPLPDDYRKDIDSEVADMKNIGKPGQAGTIVAGLFLREFVGGVPWAHLDVAATSRADEDDGYVRKGSTGFGVRTLVELVMHFEKPRPSPRQ